MDQFLFFLLTLAVAAIGGLTAYKLKVPAGGMVGSMAAVILLNLTTGYAFFYPDLKVVLQIVSGAMIGSGIGRKDIYELKTIIAPTAILLAGMVFLNISFSAAIYVFSSLDIPTALFATAPGGVADMALIATDLGANPGYVAILQLVRLLIIFSVMPPLFKFLIGRMNKTEHSSVIQQSAEEKQPLSDAMSNAATPDTADVQSSAADSVLRHSNKWYPVRLAVLILIAAGVGILFDSLKITAGALIGGMIGAALFGLTAGSTRFPKKMKIGLQIFAGAFIGIRMDRESLSQIPDLIIPILIMLIGVVLFVFLISFVMHKVTRLPLGTCMLASTPGGVQEMALLADDLGADTVKVSIMQTTRLMCVITFFPSMIKFVASLF